MPFLRGEGTPAFTGGSVTPGNPTHIVDDILLVIVGIANAAHNAACSGWTRVTGANIKTVATTAAGIGFDAFWIRATSAAMTDPTITGSSNATGACVYSIGGCPATGDPWEDVDFVIQEPAVDSQLDFPALSIAGDTTLVLYAVAGSRDATQTDTEFSAWTNSDLTDLTELTDQGTNTGAGVQLGIAIGDRDVTGAIAAGSVTSSTTAAMCGMAIAFKAGVAAVTPATAAITVTGYAPTVSVGGAGTTVTPGTAAITVTGPAPTATASDHKTATPGTAAITITATAPVVAQGFLWDTFTDTEKALVSHTGELATWALHPSFTMEARISSENRARGTTPESRPLADQVPPAAEYRILFRIHVKSASGASGITFRHHATADTAYILTYQATAQEWTLSRFISSAVVTLDGPYDADPLSAGDSRAGVIEVRSGGVMRVLLEGVEILSATDTGITATGQIGMRFGTATNTTASHWDEIRAVTIADVAVTPATAALSLTGYAPTVTGGGGGVSVTPATAALTLTGPAPTATASDHRSATPATAAITVTGPAPTVSVSDHRTVTPATATLTITGAAPTAETPIAVATGVAVLVLTGAAPTIETPVAVTPGTATLTITGNAPTVSGAVSVVPGTAALDLTGPAPSIILSDHQTATPGVAGTVLTGFAPTVGVTVSAEPATASIVLTGPAPTVEVTSGLTIIPGTASIVVTGDAPTVTATAHVTATPGTASLTVTGNAPAATVTDHRTVTPGVAAIVVTGPAPTVEVTADRTAEPGWASLTITGPAPTVTVGDNAEAVPGTAGITVTAPAPTVVVTAHVIAAPAVAALTVTGPGPTVLVTAHRIVIPGAAGITATGYAPTPTVGVNVTATPGVALLVATGYPPEITGFIPRGVAELIATRDTETAILGTRGLVTPVVVARAVDFTVSGDRDGTVGVVVQRDDDDTLTAEA